MKLCSRLLFFLLSPISILVLILLAPNAPVRAQGIIINELYNSSASDEWVELLVVQDSLDLRGWDLRDFSSGGSAQTPLVFSPNALWSSVKKGTLIVVGTPSTAFTEDTDPSDNLLIIKSGNTLYFSGGVFSFAGTSDALQIRNASQVHVVGVSWGANNASSLPAPKAHFTGSMSSGRTIFFDGDSLAQLTNTADWTFNTTTATAGTGNTPANSAWITSLRSNPDGSGSACVTPDTLMHGVTTSLNIVYRRDTAFAVTDMRIVLPANFVWSRQRSDVDYAGMAAADTVIGDTVYFNTIVFGADSAVITVSNVTAPDSTAYYPIDVQTKAVTGYRSVGPIPRIVLFGIPVTVGAIKGNDPEGVALRTGQLVTVRGIVTVANQFGGPSYIQDATGGLGIFGSTFSTAVNVGDEVVVSGRVDPFNGLTELTVPYLHAITTTGNIVQPLLVTCADVSNDGAGGLENYEGLLVRLNAVVVRDLSDAPVAAWTVTGSGTNYRLIDATDSVEVRVDNNVDFANLSAPQEAFDIIGVVSQFSAGLPYIGGYQIMPRSAADIVASGPVIASPPVESMITPSSLAITWTTVHPGTSHILYGKSPSTLTGTAGSDSMRTDHTLVLTSLDSATVYYIKAFSASGADTSFASTLIASTASAPPATGLINAYFNHSVRTDLAWPTAAAGSQDMVARIVTRINNAHRSIDAALYSLSGTAGANVAVALAGAKNRGVKVRIICEHDNRNTAPFTNLSGIIPLIDDAFDAVNQGVGLMHNKFIVIDGRGGAADSIWVWTGSCNMTDPGTLDDYQNAVEIQDPALAGAYELEFNEMWGSATDVPNASTTRFGARKTDNTPHRFVIGGTNVESYFSPSDHTTSRIIAAVNGARHSLGFAVLSFTRTDIAGALLARKLAGVKVRGVFDKGIDQFSQYGYLLGNGADVHLSTDAGPGDGLFHHKYVVIDAEDPSWNPVVLTGSHNWSSSAENQNDENSLIIRDAAIANQYLQEFAARYYQFGGGDSITVGVDQSDRRVPRSNALLQNYPNPFNPSTTISYQLRALSHVNLKLFDILGREVTTLVDARQGPGTYAVRVNGSRLASGVYFYRISAGTFSEVRKMILLR